MSINPSKSSPPLFSTDAVLESERVVTGELRQTLARLRVPGSPLRELSVSEFLEALFLRIPRDLITSRSDRAIAAIVKHSLIALRGFLTGNEKVRIDVVADGDTWSLVTTLNDSPFIVSSTAECLSARGLSLSLFVHPIFLIEGRAVALSFIEIGECSPEETSSAAAALGDTLSILQAVVFDFSTMLGTAKKFAASLPSQPVPGPDGLVELDEIRSLIEWFHDGSFFFLSTCICELKGSIVFSENRGAWNADSSFTNSLKEEVAADLTHLSQNRAGVAIRKLRLKSPVHRRSSLLHVLVRHPGNESQCVSIVGYLTSKAWAAEAEDIPVVRKKMAAVLRNEAVLPNSYDFKYITDIVDNMPTDEALCCSTDQLNKIVRLAIGLFDDQAIRSLTYTDGLKRRAVTIVVMPSDQFSASLRDEIRALLEIAFKTTPRTTGVHLDSSKRRQTRMYITIPIGLTATDLPNLLELSERISRACQSWRDRLVHELAKTGLPADFELLFPENYTVSHSPNRAVTDVKNMLALNPESPVMVAFRSADIESTADAISIYTLTRPLTISRAVPILENVGFEVLAAHSYEVDNSDGSQVFLLELSVRLRDAAPLSPTGFDRVLGPGLARVLVGNADDDLLNSLMRTADLDVRSISLLRAYCRMLWQVVTFATRGAILQALAANPSCSVLLWKGFDTKFNPATGEDLSYRREAFERISAEFTDELRSVTDINQDRVLRGLLSFVTHTLRTNFFQHGETITIKLRSELIDLMPEPRPKFELFVTSPRVEGTHLRSSMVARGGIRWSERTEDFRSEVLGLMKTQKIKNVIIVPTGAKGGFIVRQLPREPESVPAAVEAAYREYIRGLLSVTDNRVAETVRHPEGLVIYDEPDPYFVVAADKGTATFSDVANGIAVEEFKFWLGDAFASGGSKGYDHKKYGITAKGGWECVKRHFRDIELDFDNNPFSVIGLGDMSGDVFGNGLLLSRRMKLIAAFNHKHIFLDPNPDPDVSFDERQRLFEKPRSQWSDYDPSKISPGGGVLSRFDKEIRITPEVRDALGLAETVGEVLDGEQLITHILRAPADLMWNGGIGTYVKSAAESHSAVNDGTNDRVRINADELRVKVVGEGGNLGFTQRARVEFSALGGRINTDAIDNSAGVDLSDHEVNLKLLVSRLLTSGGLTGAARDSLLKEIAPDVVKLVLSDNRDQALMLTVSHMRSKVSVEQYQTFIRDMNKFGYLSRIMDGLPDDEELGERAANKIGLWRPELAVCSAAAKMWIKDAIRTSDLCTDPLLDPFLQNYFPVRVQTDFTSAIAEHPLRNEIIATQVVNLVLPLVGIPFVHSMSGIHGAAVPAVIRSVLAADMIAGGRTVRETLLSLDSSARSRTFIELWLEMNKTISDATSWLLSTHGSGYSLRQLVDLYQEDFRTLVQFAGEVFIGDERLRYSHRLEQYREAGLDENAAKLFALFRRILPILEVLWSGRKFGHDVRVVGVAYSKVLDLLGLNPVFRYESSIDATNKWEQELAVSSYQEIRRGISLVTGALLAQNISSESEIESALQRCNGYAALRSTTQEIAELSAQKKPLKVAALSIVSRQLRLLSL